MCELPEGCARCAVVTSSSRTTCASNVGAAQAAMHRLLDAADAYAEAAGLASEVPARHPAPRRCGCDHPHQLDLTQERIGTVLLATGFRAAPPGWVRRYRARRLVRQ